MRKLTGTTIILHKIYYSFSNILNLLTDIYCCNSDGRLFHSTQPLYHTQHGHVKYLLYANEVQSSDDLNNYVQTNYLTKHHLPVSIAVKTQLLS